MAACYSILFYSILIGGFILIPFVPWVCTPLNFCLFFWNFPIPLTPYSVYCGILFNMSANMNLLFSPVLLLRLFFLFFFTGQSLYDKAYSMGTAICHTTNILNYCLCIIVQRIKPPFPFIFQILFCPNPFLVRMLNLSPLDWLYNSTAPHICQHSFNISV